tara:strand:+ start:59 stop:481 length:423 start_codon:yes stop_codon:yes gene_type:complete
LILIETHSLKAKIKNMPLNEDDRKKGLEILKKMDLLKSDETPVSKGLLVQIIDMLYGTIWSKDDLLSLQERSMITLTVLVALNRENELKSHLRGAKNLGIKKEKIEEMILHVAFYSGFPTSVSASQLLNKVWDSDETNSG